MKNSASFTCSIGTTDASASLGLEIWFDDDQIFHTDHVDRTIDFEQIFSDSDGSHELRFIMKNKTAEHTVLDANGNIINDACLSLTDASFDGILLGHVFVEKAIYTHDFNGTQSETQTQCFGKLGCNGTVSLKFTTPIYLWLLEHT